MAGVERWFTDLPHVRIAMEAGTHSIWVSQQLQEMGHEVIVANVRELRAISHSDRKSDQVDAEKLARSASRCFRIPMICSSLYCSPLRQGLLVTSPSSPLFSTGDIKGNAHIEVQPAGSHGFRT
jgi:hypothetical protein